MKFNHYRKTDKPFKLYKLRLLGTKYYYIGVTQNYWQRVHSHTISIEAVINSLRWCGSVRCKCLPAHRHIGQHIFNTYEPADRVNIKLSNHLSFTILARSKKMKEIVDIENNYISRNKKYMLNVSKNSTFRFNRKHKAYARTFN